MADAKPESDSVVLSLGLDALPQNIEAEKSFLGAVFVFGRPVIDDAAAFLRPDHFSQALHGEIWEKCYEMAAQGAIPNPVTLRAFMSDKAAGKTPGAVYLAELATGAVTVTMAGEYARLIRDQWLRRQLIEISSGIRHKAQSGEAADAEQIVEWLETELAGLDLSSTKNPGPMPVGSFLDSTFTTIKDAKLKQGRVGLTTGITDLDRASGGLFPGELTLIAARPGMGKTGIALCIAWANALDGRHGAIFSIEMTPEQIMMRLLALETAIPATDMRRGSISDDQLASLESARSNITALPLSIDGTGSISISHIRHRTRQLHRKGKLNFIIIDYLGLIRPDDRYRGQKVNEIGEITGALKALAKELNIPVILLSQLSRAVEMRDDKRPHLSDLRDSGTIEQDADAVLFLYRDLYYIEQEGQPAQKSDEDTDDFLDRQIAWDEKVAKARGKAEIIIAKNRFGPNKVVNAYIDEARLFFGDLQQQPQQGEIIP